MLRSYCGQPLVPPPPPEQTPASVSEAAWSEFQTRYASEICHHIPVELSPNCRRNLSRMLGYVGGVTKAYAHLGGGAHFLELHFEESGIAALNKRVIFQCFNLESAAVTFAEVGVLPKPVPNHAGDFFNSVRKGAKSIKRLCITQKAEGTNGTNVPYESI